MSEPRIDASSVAPLEAYKFVFKVVTRQSDSWGEAGHIDNAALSSLFNDARAVFFVSVLGESFFANTEARSLLLKRITTDFFGEARYPGDLDIGAAVDHVGRSSLNMRLATFRDGECLNLCRMVMVNTEHRRPAPFTDEERALFMAHSLPGVQAGA